MHDGGWRETEPGNDEKLNVINYRASHEIRITEVKIFLTCLAMMPPNPSAMKIILNSRLGFGS